VARGPPGGARTAGDLGSAPTGKMGFATGFLGEGLADVVMEEAEELVVSDNAQALARGQA